MKMLLATALLIFASNAKALTIEKLDCATLKISTNSGIKGTNLKIGKKKEFVNEAYEDTGYQILKGKKEIAWMYYGHVAGDKFFFRKCEVADGEGSCPQEWYYIDHKSKDIKIQQADFADFSLVAHPAFCGQYLAYYGTKKANECKEAHTDLVEGVVYDLNSMKVEARVNLGCQNLGTDNEAFFPAPEWKSKEVVFEAIKTKKVSARIK